MRVCVIGAGAAGLCAARHLAENATEFSVVVLEQQGTVGGTWRYTDDVGTDQMGLPVHSSMYKDMRTNLPKEVMQFPDFPFPKDRESFVSHTVVLKYLEDYARHYDFLKFIKFNQKISNITLLDHNNSAKVDKWEIQTKDVLTNRSSNIQADAVILCVGSYSKPLYPDIPGLDTFEGRVLHSHDYRDPEDFRDLRVTVVGAGSSGIDIAIYLCTVAQQVNLCHNKETPIFNRENKPYGLKERSGLDHIRGSKIILTNGKSFDTDVILLCTGYHISSKDLLDPKIGLKVTYDRFTTLYRHLIHASHPTLAILGVLKMVSPLPLFNQQVLFLLSIWKGDTVLPTLREMLEENETEFQKRKDKGWPVRYAHKCSGELQWQLIHQMEQESGIPRLPEYYSKLYEFVSSKRSENPVEYKNLCFGIVDEETFEII